MFRYKDGFKVPTIEPQKDKNGNVIDPSPVDQFDAQPFIMGENGFQRHPMSVITKMEESDLRTMLLDRLQEMSQTKGFDPDTPVHDILEQIIPRYVQTAASLRDYVGSMEKGSIADFTKKLKEQEVKEQPKEVVEPAPSVESK